MNNLTKNLLTFRSATFAGGVAAGIAIDLFSEHIHSTLDRIRRHVIDRCSVVLTIEDSTEAYDWINFWFHSSKYCDLVNNLSVGVLYDEDEDDDSEKRNAHVMLTPGQGSHLVKFDGTYFMLIKSNDGQPGNASGYSSGGPRPADSSQYAGKRIFSTDRNVITLKCLRRDKRKLLRFIEHAKDLYLSRGKKQSTLYQCKYGRWYKKTLLMPRTIDSLILDDGILEELIGDIRWFFDNRVYYYDRSIPYRRGYLLYGPPGTGKTSTIIALARHFNIDVYYMDVGATYFDDSDFVDAIAMVPHNSFLVIEDIDTATTARKDADDKSPGLQINKGTILNSIDGLFASEGRVLFMTTNHKDKIYEALLRPGRCDMQICFDYASKSQIRRMIKRFFPDAGDDILDAGVSICDGRQVSPALLQELFMTAKTKDDVIQVLSGQFGRKSVLQCGAVG